MLNTTSSSNLMTQGSAFTAILNAVNTAHEKLSRNEPLTGNTDSDMYMRYNLQKDNKSLQLSGFSLPLSMGSSGVSLSAGGFPFPPSGGFPLPSSSGFPLPSSSGFPLPSSNLNSIAPSGEFSVSRDDQTSTPAVLPHIDHSDTKSSSKKSL